MSTFSGYSAQIVDDFVVVLHRLRPHRCDRTPVLFRRFKQDQKRCQVRLGIANQHSSPPLVASHFEIFHARASGCQMSVRGRVSFLPVVWAERPCREKESPVPARRSNMQKLIRTPVVRLRKPPSFAMLFVRGFFSFCRMPAFAMPACLPLCDERLIIQRTYPMVELRELNPEQLCDEVALNRLSYTTYSPLFDEVEGVVWTF